MRVKICGLTSREEVLAASRAGADAVGFVTEVDKDTHRDMDRFRAAMLANETPAFVSTVAVTLNRSVDELLGIDHRVNPDFLQIHGEYSASEIESIVDQVNSRVIRATSPSEFNEDELRGVSGLLLDTYEESGAGGTGKTHDWSESRRIRDMVDVPVIIAGGLNPENVAEAIQAVEPFGVDVSTGVERDKKKDSDLVSEFIEAAHRAGGLVDV